MDNSERVGDYGQEDEILVDIIMDDLKSHVDDIDERSTISGMVSDSVSEDMVIVVEQEAAERTAKKESELVELRKMVHIHHVGGDETKTPVVYKEPQGAVGTGVEQDRLVGYVQSFRVAANEQLEQLKKEMNTIRGVGSIRRTSSDSELVGRGGFLQEKVPGRWIYIDKTFESLKDKINSLCRTMEDMDQLSNKTFSEWQQEQELQSEIEGMVISNCIRNLQQEFEQKLLDQNAQIYDSESVNWLDKLKEISGLRQELDSISKTISVFENGQLISHSSLENVDEQCDNKRTDHFHCRVSTNHLSPSALERDGNGEDSRNNKPENLDSVSLKHLSGEELMAHFNSEINKLRRNHESQLAEMTEEIFCLKRELLREQRSSSSLKKDKEFDVLRKKILDFISKLDNILVGNEKVHLFNENIKSLSTSKDRSESLHSDNHRLRDTLMDKQKESKSISSQLSDAVEELSQQKLTEQNLLQKIQKLECDIGDSDAEFSIIQDVYKCLLEEMMGEFRRIGEESYLMHTFMEEIYEIIIRETEDADVESVIRLGILELIFKETLIDIRVNLERESIKNIEALQLEAAEKEKQEQEMLMLMSKLEEKDKVAQELADALKVKRRKMDELRQNLDRRTMELRKIDEERKKLHALTLEKEDSLTLIEAREMETRNQMGATIVLAHELLTAVSSFESRVNKDISRNCLRVESMSSVFHCLIEKANILKTNGLLYKQRLETSCSNLEKAEAEVDLLANEVDTCFSFLGEIYKKLDHYSPILQHYPGITEILELVRRKLIEESRMPV